MKNWVTRLAMIVLVPTAVSAKGVHFLHKNDRQLCESDRLALCVGVARKDSEACLIQNADQISDADCRSAVQTAKANVQDFMNACQTDIDVHCSGLDFGSDLMACLKKHRRDLSGSCREQL